MEQEMEALGMNLEQYIEYLDSEEEAGRTIVGQLLSPCRVEA